MEYLVVMYRMITVITLFLVVAILMGKRHLGEFSVFDFVIAITLGAVAGADLADPQIPHGPTYLTIIGLGFLHYLLSKFILKNRKIGYWLTFDPTVVVQNGVILKENLSKLRYTVEELLTHLREKGVFDLQEVEFAVLEPTGTLSVLKKSQYHPVTAGDLRIAKPDRGLSFPVILEGKFHRRGLETVNWSEKKLKAKLQKMGFEKPEEIFLALVNTQGDLYISPQIPPTPIQPLNQ